MKSTIVDRNNNPGCLIQILWFALIGWWLGQAWLVVAWISMVTIIGIPLGVIMVNKLPYVLALRSGPIRLKISQAEDGSLIPHRIDQTQPNILLRAVYFLLVGWWLTAIWMELAFALCATVIGIPIGFWMFDRVPAILSLHRN
jgi:uncharacterized membrane protein YccF (DUF307 family)